MRRSYQNQMQAKSRHIVQAMLERAKSTIKKSNPNHMQPPTTGTTKPADSRHLKVVATPRLNPARHLTTKRPHKNTKRKMPIDPKQMFDNNKVNDPSHIDLNLDIREMDVHFVQRAETIEKEVVRRDDFAAQVDRIGDVLLMQTTPAEEVMTPFGVENNIAEKKSLKPKNKNHPLKAS